ncbi:hypothetical protein [Erythrobacter sp. HKB08]|uniref:hypothetical protein n=1 Tax=Erythrobacter sp. HKB08 TaxID=2502843 RepID=UPI001008D428|nr:hypothetical protein [Erythrobacter sp. HKB08]
MTEQTDVLKLVLNELEMSHGISTMDDRIGIQKVVCLVQEAGLQLGYSYNWYVRGPYSPSLASDYYALAQNGAENGGQKLVLTDFAKSVVQKVRPLLDPPEEFTLGRVYWLELLASILYLRKRLRMTDEASRAKIQLSKATLHPYYDLANNALNELDFL